MFSSSIRKSCHVWLMAGLFLLAAGCVKHTAETEKGPASPAMQQPAPKAPAAAPPKSMSEQAMPKGGMTEADRRRARVSFQRAMAEFENELVHFDFDMSEIRPDMRAKLDAKARFLQEFQSIRVQVEGHCDERGTVEYNIALGHRRSQSAKDYLVSLGVSASRIDTVSYGEERPLDGNSNEGAWAKNRRAKFNVIGGIPAGMN